MHCVHTQLGKLLSQYFVNIFKVGAIRRPWQWIGPEADLVRKLLCASHINAIRYLKGTRKGNPGFSGCQ